MIFVMAALAFRPRWDRLDEILIGAAKKRNPNAYSLERALNEPGLSLFEIFPPPDELPGNYGRVSRSVWCLVDELFKPSGIPEDSPPGMQSKSVQVADIYETPPAGGFRTTFLFLWSYPIEPVMVAFHEIVPELLEAAETLVVLT